MSAATSGRGVLVIGGAGGIGDGVVARFLAAGERVVVIDRAPVTGENAAAITGEFLCDVADAVAFVDAIGAAEDLLGGIDAAVNCAGILRISTVADTTLEEWDLVQAVNARASFVAIREIGVRMLAAGGGSIVTIASMAAKHGGHEEIASAASKAAVVAMTRVAALEWGRQGVRVNAVCPGYIPTRMGADSRTAEDVARWESQTSLGRLGTPQDVADVVHFLSGPESAYMTGQALNITGGMVMH